MQVHLFVSLKNNATVSYSTDYIYISLLIISCIIEYVTNKRILNLEMCHVPLFHVRMSVFVLACVIPPTVNLPNDIQHPWLPVGGKDSILQPWK